MTIKPIPNAEDILAKPDLFAQLNAFEQFAAICSAKSNVDTLIAVGKADIAARQTALDVSAAAVLNPLKERSRALKAQAAEHLTNHRQAIMGDAKTLEVAGQSIGYRFANAVECEGDEEAIIRQLDLLACDVESGPADRMSAEACLKRDLPKLNKNFILSAAKKSAAWFRAIGIIVTREEKLSIKPTATADIED